MSGLAFAQAPPSSHPLRFLLTALIWGIVAGVWLCVHGGELLISRWHPATLALVHMLALGVLGNAMIGSLYQFLPVAAGSPLPMPRSAAFVHGLLNLGMLALIACFLHPHPHLAACAIALLGTSLLLMVGQGGYALLRGNGARAVRIGIGCALACLMITVLLGGRLLAMLVAWLDGALDLLVDAHAAFGLAGWGLGLLASVGSIAVPMLQGTKSLRGRWLLLWWALLLCALAAMVRASLDPAAAAWRYPLIVPVLVLCVTLAVLHWRAPHPRNPVLRRFWVAALFALTSATLVALLPLYAMTRATLIGILVLAMALPWFVLGMLLEIVTFLAWIALRRRLPRGVRVPGVGRLMDDARKQRVWWLHVTAGTGLLVSVAVPSLTVFSGLAFIFAYAFTLWTVARCWREALHFQPAP